jgi:multiple sugar transport system permease protein
VTTDSVRRPRRAPHDLTASIDWEAQRRRAFALGLAPALVVLAAITLGPTLYLFGISLTPLNLVDPRTAYDFADPTQNYRAAFVDPRFVNSVWVQVKLSVATVTLQLLVGLGVALMLNLRSRFLEAVRTAFLIPMVLPPIVVAVIWKVMYVTDVSPLHRALDAVGLPVSSLIANADTALWAIAAAETWEWFPFTMLMVLAALQMIPDEPIEAAKIDGAGPSQLFWYVVLPYIQPTLVVAGLFRLIDSVKAFPLIYVLTNGGPGTVTEVTNYYAFIQALNFSFWGYSSAIATLLVAGVLLLSWIIGRLGADRSADD